MSHQNYELDAKLLCDHFFSEMLYKNDDQQASSRKTKKNHLRR